MFYPIYLFNLLCWIHFICYACLVLICFICYANLLPFSCFAYSWFVYFTSFTWFSCQTSFTNVTSCFPFIHLSAPYVWLNFLFCQEYLFYLFFPLPNTLGLRLNSSNLFYPVYPSISLISFFPCNELRGCRVAETLVPRQHSYSETPASLLGQIPTKCESVREAKALWTVG